MWETYVVSDPKTFAFSVAIADPRVYAPIQHMVDTFPIGIRWGLLILSGRAVIVL
jgi:hypothetical protein